jgi:hypothetical protein
MSRGIFFSVALAVAGAQSALAAEDTIATDRPDMVESSDVVGRGRFQIETSMAFERDKSGTSRSRVSSTPTLLRIGLSDTWELRLETDGRMRSTGEDPAGRTRDSGFADAALGIKWHMQDGDESKGLPGIAWLVHVDWDSGSAPFRGQGLRPSVRMVAEWDLPHDVSVGVMPGLFADRNAEGRRFVGGILAAVASKSLTDRLRGFVELAATRLTSSRNGGNFLTFDSGLAYLLTKDMQIDVAVARGLTKTTPDFAWTIGWSARF